MGRVSLVGMYIKENSMKEMVKPLIPIKGKKKCQKIKEKMVEDWSFLVRLGRFEDKRTFEDKSQSIR
jgi:hypothetical protein